MSEETEHSPVEIPSDALRGLLKLRAEFPFFRQLLADVIQIVVVLDASFVQGELRWRLASRRKPGARTRLHEAIDSGAVIAVAPIFLKQEIEKYLPLIAGQTGVSVEAAEAEWKSVQHMIRFYVPSGEGAEFASIDPKDAPYALTARELEADFVRTTDPHFARMGLTAIGPDMDPVLRDYARATSVLVNVKLGSGLALTFGIQVFVEMIRSITDMIQRLPPAAKLILAAALAITLLHPTSREKLLRWAQKIWERLKETRPVLISISQGAVKHLAGAAKTSRTTRKAIQSRLRVRGKQTALSHARIVCLRSKQPLHVEEIARRILMNGYSSRSKTFPEYVRHLLRKDPCFARNAHGLWAVRAVA